MSGRTLYRNNEGTELAKALNRIDALERRRAVSGFYQIKVFADDEEVETGNGAFIFAIPWDLNRSRFNTCNCYITTVSSSGLVTVQIHNRTASSNITSDFDMLTTPLTIDVGEFDAENAATPAVIDTGATQYAYPDLNNTVYYRQQIRIDVDTAGTGAMGLGVMLGFD